MLMQTKKIMFFALMAAISLSSCTTLKKTATSIDVASVVQSNNQAELDISKSKITYTYRVPSKIAKLGEKNAINAAVIEALNENGGGDVLVAPQYEIVKKKSKTKRVTVTGYPGTYKNFTVNK